MTVAVNTVLSKTLVKLKFKIFRKTLVHFLKIGLQTT